MALQVRRTSSNKVRLISTLIAVFALIAQPMYGLVASQAANAASSLIAAASATVSRSATYRSATVDAGAYQNLTLSFDYDASELDANPSPDSFTYGWTANGVDHQLGQTINGIAGNNPSEKSSVSEQLPSAAFASGLSIYVKVAANTDSDIVRVTNLKLDGAEKPSYIYGAEVNGPAVFTANVGSIFTVTTHTTDPTGDTTPMVRAYFTDGSAGGSYEYEDQNGSFQAFNGTSGFGPASGFEYVDGATSTFRVTYPVAGSYTSHLEFKEVGTSAVIAQEDVSFAVSNPQSIPTIQPCSSINEITVDSLIGWDTSETGTTGHNELTTEGLHVWTEGGTSTDKSAAYKAASFKLADLGQGFGLETIGTDPTPPALQLTVDLDGNGTLEGNLVAEPVAYGSDTLWLSSNWSNIDLSSAPSTTNGGGTGKGGTVNAWLAAFPDAKIVAIGYSLGSGVKGDFVVKSLTAGCAKYIFAAAPIDIQKPTATLTTPAVNSYNPTQMVVESHDETSLKTVTANIYNTANTSLIKSCSNNASGSKDYTLTCAVPSTLPEGIYTIRANASDKDGHISTTTIRQFTIDHTAPKITAKTGSSFTQGSGDTYKKVSFGLYDKYKVAKYDINGTVTNVSPNAYSDANYITVGSRGAKYGANTITLYDMAGNTSSYGFTLDNVAPAIAVKDGFIGDKDAKIFSSVSFALYDTYKVDAYDINGYVSDFSDNKWSDANFQNIKSHLIEGDNTLVLYDVVGNSTIYTFTYDSTKPAATSITHSNNDGNALTKNDVTVTLTASEEVQNIDGWTRVGPVQFIKSFDSNGPFSVTLVDLAGNSSVANGIVKRIDRAAPMISGVSNGDVVNSGVSLSIFDPAYQGAFGFNAAHGLTINGIETMTTETSDHRFLVNTITADGKYTVVATDKAGNSSQIEFTVDTVAPILTINSPELLPDGTYRISGTSTEGATPIRLAINNGSSRLVTPNSAGIWSVALGALNAGARYTLTVSTMDKASNSFEKSQSFLISPVDTTAGLTVALAVPTQLSTATPSLSSAFTPAPIPATANNDDTEVLGTKTTRTPLTDTAAIAASPEGWKFFGVAWYWLLIALAAISGLWWLAAARRRVAEDV